MPCDRVRDARATNCLISPDSRVQPAAKSGRRTAFQLPRTQRLLHCEAQFLVRNETGKDPAMRDCTRRHFLKIISGRCRSAGHRAQPAARSAGDRDRLLQRDRHRPAGQDGHSRVATGSGHRLQRLQPLLRTHAAGQREIRPPAASQPGPGHPLHRHGRSLRLASVREGHHQGPAARPVRVAHQALAAQGDSGSRPPAAPSRNWIGSARSWASSKSTSA